MLRNLALARFRALTTFIDREITNLAKASERSIRSARNVEQLITQMDGFVADSEPVISRQQNAQEVIWLCDRLA